MPKLVFYSRSRCFKSDKCTILRLSFYSSILLHLTGSANFSGWRISLREDPQCCWNLDSCKKIKNKNSRCCYKTYFRVIVSRSGRKNSFVISGFSRKTNFACKWKLIMEKRGRQIFSKIVRASNLTRQRTLETNNAHLDRSRR